MRAISSGKRGMAGEGNSGDHRVSDLAGSSLALARCHQIGRMPGGVRVEWSDAPLDFTLQELFKGFREPLPAATQRHGLQAEMDFHNRNRRNPYGGRRLSVEPLDD